MNNSSKVLVVALDNLGDAVMASAIFKACRNHWPGVKIGFLGKSYVSGLFSESDQIKVHLADPFWDGSPLGGRGSLKKFFQVLNEVRRENYDSAIVLNAEWRRSAAVFWSGIPRRFGFAKRKSQIFLNLSFPFPSKKMHSVEEHLELLSLITRQDLKMANNNPQLNFDPIHLQDGQRWIEALGWEGKPVVLLHFFTGAEKRNWPIENWKELIQILSKNNSNLRFAVLCTSEQREILEPSWEFFNSHLWQFVSGDLAQLKGYFSRAAIFIGGDSGPGHMAAAYGIPVVSLFGASDPDRCRPIGRNTVRVIKHDPINNLPATTVAQAVEESLKL